MAENICEKMKIFYRTTTVFSDRNTQQQICFLMNLCNQTSFERVVRRVLEVTGKMVANMIEKFDEYWSAMNETLVIATILDPRNKMDYVDLCSWRI